MSDEPVLYEQRDRVARITLNRPDSLNAWIPDFGEALLRSLDRAAEDPDVRVILLTGAGRAFSAGADLKGPKAVDANGNPAIMGLMRNIYNPVISRLRHIHKPVIAAVNGPAVGIGASLALASDLIVVADSAYFLFAFVNIGLTLDGGASALLPARLGHARAFELAYLGNRLSAQQALDWGMVNSIVPSDELDAEVSSMAAKLASGPPGSFAATKKLMNARIYAGFDGQLEDEALIQQQLIASADHREGVAAFVEKRAPAFSGT